MTITRPDVVYDDKKHTYTLNGEKLLGVSTVSKVGEDEIWGVAAAWAFRIGYEGAFDVLGPSEDFQTADDLREGLKHRRKTPWVKRDGAAERGNHIHDALEHLAQHGKAPILEQYPDSERGYIQALSQWFVDYRPTFEATEVQVVSVEHRFAGRYDIRASIGASYLDDTEGPARSLCLIDLKTSKHVYPTSHFAQLAGYELASIEMGFPKTDAQYILNCKADGSYEFVKSNAEARHFLAYLEAARMTKDLKARNKKERKK